MNFFDIEKTKTRFLVLYNDKEIKEIENTTKFDKETEGKYYPFSRCYLYIYEGLSLEFIIFVNKNKYNGSQLLLNDIEVSKISVISIEASAIRLQIVDKIKMDFIKYLMSNEVVQNCLKQKEKITDRKEVSKEKNNEKSNEHKEEPILDVIKEEEKKKQDLEIKDKPIDSSVQDKEATIDNDFGYNESKDNIVFDSSMPEQKSPHENTNLNNETEVSNDDSNSDTVTKEDVEKIDEPKKNMFDSSLDDDYDFSDVMSLVDEDEESNVTNF